MRGWTCRLAWVALLFGLAAGSLHAEDEGGQKTVLDPGGAPSGGTLLRHEGEVRRLSLEEAIRLALRTNLRLQSTAYDPRIAMESLRAASAIFDPELTANLDYGYAEEPNLVTFFGRPVLANQTFHGEAGVARRTRTGGRVAFLYQADRLDTDQEFIELNPSWEQDIGIVGEQPLMRGAGDVVMVDIRRARNGLRIAQEGQRTAVEAVLLEVVTAYWRLVLAQEEILARRKSEDVAAELLRDAEARYAAKVGTPLQVAEAHAGLERRIGDRIEAEGARGNVQDLLRTLIYPFTPDGGETGYFVVATSGEAAVEGMSPDPSQLDRYVQLAVANRPQLRASQWDIQNRSLDVYQAADAVRPQLDLYGRVGTTGLDEPFGGSFEEMATGQAMRVGAGLQFSMFVGQRAARANLRLAEWARRQAVIDRKELENQVILDVRTAIRDVVVAQAREDSAEEEVASAEANLKGERALLANGKSTPFNVLLKEDELTNARVRIYRAQADRRIAEARFWRAMGFLADTLGVPGRTTAATGDPK